MRRSIIYLVAALAIPSLAQATEIDPRHQYRDYDTNAVYDIVVHMGYVTTIFLQADEQIEITASGDAKAWDIQISDNRKMIFIKPVVDPDLDYVRKTNLMVVTDRRTYAFGIEATTLVETPDVIYTVRFEKGRQVSPTPARRINPPAPKPKPSRPEPRPEPVQKALPRPPAPSSHTIWLPEPRCDLCCNR